MCTSVLPGKAVGARSLDAGWFPVHAPNDAVQVRTKGLSGPAAKNRCGQKVKPG